MTGGFTKAFSLLSGLSVGTIFGVYLSQNYTIPDIGMLLGKLQDKAEGYTKSDGSTKKD